MSKLQRKIKSLEMSMNHDMYSMQRSRAVLARYTHSLRFVLTASTLTFILGMVLGYKRNLLKVASTLASLTAKFYKLRSKVRLLLPIIP